MTPRTLFRRQNSNPEPQTAQRQSSSVGFPKENCRHTACGKSRRKNIRDIYRCLQPDSGNCTVHPGLFPELEWRTQNFLLEPPGKMTNR